MLLDSTDTLVVLFLLFFIVLSCKVQRLEDVIYVVEVGRLINCVIETGLKLKLQLHSCI